jgi:hypothetical protein
VTIDGDWQPSRTIGTFTRRSETGVLIETYHDGYEVNETGAFIWSHIGGGQTVTDIARELADKYGIGLAYAQTVVQDFLTELRDRGFLAAD